MNEAFYFLCDEEGLSLATSHSQVSQHCFDRVNSSVNCAQINVNASSKGISLGLLNNNLGLSLLSTATSFMDRWHVESYEATLGIVTQETEKGKTI